MKKTDYVKQLKDRDNRTTDQESMLDPSNIVGLDDSILSSISGGCALTTPGTSCVPPGVQCP